MGNPNDPRFYKQPSPVFGAVGVAGTVQTALAPASAGGAQSTVDLERVGGSSIQTGSGVSGAGVQRVALASDSVPGDLYQIERLLTQLLAVNRAMLLQLAAMSGNSIDEADLGGDFH